MRWKRYTLVFLMTAVIGLAIGAAATPVVAGKLFGPGPYVATLARLGLPLLALAAVVAGYLFPKGFPLWGLAVVSLHPVVYAWLASRSDSPGMFESSGISDLELIGLAVVVMVATATVCTVAAALGAGLRLLWWWIRGESVSGRLGMTSGSSGPT